MHSRRNNLSNLEINDLDTELLNHVNVTARRSKDNHQIIKALISMLRKFPNSETGNSTNSNASKPELHPREQQTETEKSLHIIRNNLSDVPTTLTVQDVVNNETWQLLQYLITESRTDSRITAKEYYAKIENVIADILRCVQEKVSNLR